MLGDGREWFQDSAHRETMVLKELTPGLTYSWLNWEYTPYKSWIHSIISTFTYFFICSRSIFESALHYADLRSMTKLAVNQEKFMGTDNYIFMLWIGIYSTNIYYMLPIVLILYWLLWIHFYKKGKIPVLTKWTHQLLAVRRSQALS